MPQTSLSVHKQITVHCGIDRAFDVFTAGIDAWWPRASHSVGGADCARVEIEPRVGGRIVEHLTGGTTSEWGRIIEWDPPRALAFTWHPGRDASTAGEVRVRFADAGGGSTTVTLDHTGFEKMGDDAREIHANYDSGWAYVLGEYLAATPRS